MNDDLVPIMTEPKIEEIVLKLLQASSWISVAHAVSETGADPEIILRLFNRLHGEGRVRKAGGPNRGYSIARMDS